MTTVRKKEAGGYSPLGLFSRQISKVNSIVQKLILDQGPFLLGENNATLEERKGATNIIGPKSYLTPSPNYTLDTILSPDITASKGFRNKDYEGLQKTTGGIQKFNDFLRGIIEMNSTQNITLTDIDPWSGINGTMSAFNSSASRNQSLSLGGDGMVWEFLHCDTLILSPFKISLCLILIICAIATIFGNTLVIVAIVKESYLHTVTNYYVMSLAVSDCLVGALVMPFSALYDSFNCWFFGPDFCDVWHSVDVLASTASILNLCVISMDRYWAITDPLSYPSRMSPKRAYILIALVWVCSAIISFPAIAYWRARSDPHPVCQCYFTEDLPYLFFSSTISFYLPLIVMVFTYFRIYRAAAKQTRSLRLGQKIVSTLGDTGMELTLRIHRGGGGSHYSQSYSQRRGGKSSSSSRQSNDSYTNRSSDEDQCNIDDYNSRDSPINSSRAMARNLKNFSISRKICKFAMEKRAAKTLGIVMGVFIICWLPFFVNNLRLGLCGQSCSTETATHVTYVVTWLGWMNSAMNPVIYALWAKDFRKAFTRILFTRRCRRRLQTDARTGIAQIVVTPVVSTLNTPFLKVTTTDQIRRKTPRMI